MKKNTTLFGLLATTILLGFSQCRKASTVAVHQSISFENNDLKSMELAIKGRWELQRIAGGLCVVCESPVTHNPYMILSADHVVIGDDSLGVTEDAPITWQPADYFGSGYVFFTPTGMGRSPREIRNDTLLVQHYAADGATYYYTRSR